MTGKNVFGKVLFYILSIPVQLARKTVLFIPIAIIWGDVFITNSLAYQSEFLGHVMVLLFKFSKSAEFDQYGNLIYADETDIISVVSTVLITFALLIQVLEWLLPRLGAMINSVLTNKLVMRVVLFAGTVTWPISLWIMYVRHGQATPLPDAAGITMFAAAVHLAIYGLWNLNRKLTRLLQRVQTAFERSTNQVTFEPYSGKHGGQES